MNVDKIITDMFDEHSRKNANGTLTVGEAFHGYYRLLEGDHAGRVIIKGGGQIDGRSIIHYANGLTWQWIDKIKDIRCESVGVQFSQGNQKIDYSEATWYDDNSSEPRHYSW